MRHDLWGGRSLAAIVCLPAMSLATPPCGDWNLEPTPNVGNSVTRLTAVSASSADDAWAVGLWRSNPVGSGPVVMRWDGSAWNLTSLPGTSHLGTLPQTEGVETTQGDVWVVGSLTTAYPTNNLPLVLRWRGGGWDHVGTVTLRPQRAYPFGARGGFLYEVAAITPDDIWAVGQGAGYGDATATSVPLAAHWNGSGWTDVEVPLVANRHHELTDVVAISTDDVWAVGDYRNIGGLFRGITYHWDGAGWSHIDSPVEHMGSTGLDDIAASGPNDVWALGGGDSGVIVMRWDGAAWTLMPPPPNSGGSIAVLGPSDVWVSGWNGFWHWDGTAWTEVAAAVPGSTYIIRSGGMEIVGECDLWCVGFSTLADGITSSTLAERLVGSGPGCDPDVNCDGVPDQGDVACMVLAVAGDTGCFCQADPDFNGDGVPDQGDVADVILAVAGAPCP